MSPLKMNEVSVTDVEVNDFLNAIKKALLEDDYIKGVPLFALKKNMTNSEVNIERVRVIAEYLVEIDKSILRSGKKEDGFYTLNNKPGQGQQTRVGACGSASNPSSKSRLGIPGSPPSDLSDIVKGGEW